MEVLKDCKTYAHNYYQNLLLAAEKNINDALFQQSEAAKSNEEQRRFFDAMLAVKNHSSLMHDAFIQHLLERFKRFSEGYITADQQDHGPEELSLVNRQKLEDDLAISVIVSKANSRYSEQLWKLNRRLAVLRSGTPVEDEDNPFGPAVIGEALQKAVATLNLDAKARIFLYRILGKLFIIGFDKPLKDLNERLRAAGILANLKFSAYRPDTVEFTARQTIEEPDLANESAESIQHQQKMYETIRDIQAHSGPKTHTVGGISLEGVTAENVSAKESFAEMDYALALSAVQQSKDFLQAASLNRPMPAEQVEKKVVEQLKKQGGGQARNKMSRDDADTVDLVGMIFRYILDDKNLHDSVKSLLSHLHTPYLKLALMDKTFISNYQHSARILINSLADVGGRWVKDENDRTALPKIKTIVETILKGFVDDFSIFDRLLEDFQRFREGLDKRAKMVERRNTESQQGLERLEMARQQAESEVISRFDQGGVHERASHLLLKPWGDFLSFNLLRHGDESSTWQSALKVVDAVVWSIQEKQAVDNTEDFHRRQQAFETSIKEGLLAMGYDPEASANLLRSLRDAQELAYHDAVMSKQNKLKPKSELVEEVVSTIPAKATAIEKQKHALQTKINEKKKIAVMSDEERQQLEGLQDIAFGTWFIFNTENSKTEKLKLAWYSRVTSNYMFVNNAGLKQRVITNIDLAKAMVAGSVRIASMERRSFMERAFEAVVKTLSRKSPEKGIIS